MDINTDAFYMYHLAARGLFNSPGRGWLIDPLLGALST